MGPIALFDKSFLQSLSLDESVWFDHFFLANVCPIFYAETQSDLAKEDCKDITREELVRRIADRFPGCSGSPNVHHAMMCTANLLGEEVPLRPQVILPRGYQGTISGHPVSVFPLSVEAKAFLRWAQGIYEEEERQAAAEWRQQSFGNDTAMVMGYLKDRKLYQETSYATLLDVKTATDELLKRLRPDQQLALALQLVGVYGNYVEQIIVRFYKEGEPDLARFAPYATFALRIELLFHIAVHKGRLNVAHRMDMTYLFYLPFCQFFVSADRVHQNCAPLFLRDDQEFIWGPDLKEALKTLNSRIPDEDRGKAIYQIAPMPPIDGDNLVTKLWDRHWPTWRTPGEASSDANSEVAFWQKQLPAIRKIAESGGDELLPSSLPFDAIVRKRTVPRKKGSWRLV
jgi:hypothetical protein